MAFRFLVLLWFVALLPKCSLSQNPDSFYQRYIRSQDIFRYLDGKKAPSLDTALLFERANNGSIAQSDAGDIFSVQNRLKFADYLFKNRQYSSAANEYHEILKADRSPKNLSLYEKSLLFAGDYQKAEDFVDSLSSSFSVKAYNIRSCIFVITDNYAAFDTLKQDLLLPSIVMFRNMPVRYKSVPLATAMSAVVPGSGQIYSGNLPQGIVTLIVSALDAAHIVYGVRKYGISNFYPIVSIGFGTGFYLSNIFKTARLTRKTNSNIKNYRNEKLLDYMSTVLF